LLFDKTEGRNIVNTCLTLIRQAIERHHFLEKNSRVLIGVSGGIDSISLLLLLTEYNRRYNQKWEIHACHVNPQFPGWDATSLKKIFKKHNIRHTMVRTTIYQKIKALPNKCFFCSRERRKRLLETADRLNIFQVALAHHKEDAAETMLLNMIYNGEISTLVPKQSVIQGRFFFIRPLYYLDKGILETLVRIYKIPVAGNVCPFYKNSKRETIRRFLKRLEKGNPDAYHNIFRAIFHIKKTYMP